jgi:hypothetical protein
MPSKPKSKGRTKSISEGPVISVVTTDLADADAQVRGLFRRPEEIRYARVNITAEQLSVRFNEFFGTFDKVLSDLPPSVGGLNLDTITIGVEISAKGTVSLFGTGGEVAGKAGVTFTLKRNKPA